MDIRTCRSCKYYEISPIRRMGWCCHPRLVPPQHRHLVWEDELDCDRQCRRSARKRGNAAKAGGSAGIS